MRVLVTGATGVIGRLLVPMLSADGHHVTALVRDSDAVVEADQVVVADLLDRAATRKAVADARPEAVVHQATALRGADAFARTARLRAEGTAHLAEAAAECGVRRFVAQSIAFATSPGGGEVLDERAPLYLDAPDESWAATVRAIAELERIVLGRNGIVLRYGMLYGPGTGYDLDGPFGTALRAGRSPLAGQGTGITSFLHVRDAASAAAHAVAQDATGVFNIVDDEPAAARTWLPHWAQLTGGPEPRVVAEELAARLLGWFTVHQHTAARGASNQRAREELGWKPSVSSWREWKV
ncbi:dTDP-glucose 4,6-dehydratase [Lentzea sp. NBRC 105346]|uniref:NAD-dependent epimerase/dehydratase family protein n=1 Tax=Lentzea sp. NBRC 105346 TaxID=3032205 RepID=UPI0024A34963|nr:NAD(P)-dependent oxidoreductase [Lentzea sp. NBRC 105346]GLZ35014.1 dTDP-glucose 4,6-dehydratase [Lentzea sp. NBRC 105346]